MDYQKLQLVVASPELREILEAELGELPFESFESPTPKTLQAYMPVDLWDAAQVDPILSAYAEHILSQESMRIQGQNWNAVWESQYEPVIIEHLFIGASFHTPSENTDQVIILNPNMSFGTGHHPTTHLMLEGMMNMDLKGKAILDFGSGSGILSIYAGQQGAHGEAIEIDAHAADAGRENLTLNDIESFEMITGGIESVKPRKFEIILANINRNVIQECLPVFRQSMAPKGKLLCSGFFISDVDELSASLETSGFLIDHVSQRGDWAMITSHIA